MSVTVVLVTLVCFQSIVSLLGVPCTNKLNVDHYQGNISTNMMIGTEAWTWFNQDTFQITNVNFQCYHSSHKTVLLHLCLSVVKGWVWELLKQTSFNGRGTLNIAQWVLMAGDISQQGKDPPARFVVHVYHPCTDELHFRIMFLCCFKYKIQADNTNAIETRMNESIMYTSEAKGGKDAWYKFTILWKGLKRKFTARKSSLLEHMHGSPVFSLSTAKFAKICWEVADNCWLPD